jgi:hypothetical protein
MKKRPFALRHAAIIFFFVFSLATSVLAQGFARFLTSDTTTQGNWQGKYGVDGYFIGNTSYQSPASYAVFTVQNASGWTWASGTSDPRALAIPSGNEGVASCWYSSSSFAFDVNLTDGNTHQVALYALDWDNWMGGRVETITIVDPSTQAVLDTRTITVFTNGIYLVWNLSGHVQINVTNNNSASNAVISGVLFGTPLIVTTTSLAIGQQGTAYNATLTASGGVSPYSWTLTSGALPAGLSLNSSTGVISGTPTATVNASALAFKVTDSTTPTAQTDITSLTITIVSGAGHSVLLSWDASLSYATSGYNVYRSNISGSSYAKINSAPVPGLSYTDATVASGQTYYYVTTAVDSIGDESGFSNEIQEVVP